ncbi:ComEC family competence protein [Patescibacteria group bacterium]|nr:ComEC family competence protein [Patescibacteria group bacterium]
MEDALKPYLLLRTALIGFIFGVLVLGFYFEKELVWLFICLAVACVAGFFILYKKSFNNQIILPTVFIFGAIFAAFVFQLSFTSKNSIANITGDEYIVEGNIVRVELSENYQKVTVTDLYVEGRELKDKILVFVPVSPKLSYGDRIRFTCDLQAPEPFDGFDYDKYLASKNIYATCFLYDAPQKIASGQGNFLSVNLQMFKGQMIKRLDRLIGEPHASLLAGLLFGEKRFSEKWNTIFTRTGTTHIVAASGYNVSVVTFLAFAFLVAAGIKRRQAFFFLFFCIVCYVLLAGADAAVVRAGIMGGIILISRQLGRRASMLNILLLTASLMLVVNPLYLRYDVGFQLSMLSTIGLIYIAPLLDKKLVWIPKEFAVRESFTATIAATLCSLPIIILNFRAFSVVSLFANAMILPLIPYIMACGAIGIFISAISTQLGIIIIAPAWAGLEIILYILESLSSLPFASV